MIDELGKSRGMYYDLASLGVGKMKLYEQETENLKDFVKRGNK